MENKAEKKELSGEQLEPVAGGNDVPEPDTDVEGLNMCRSYGHTYEVIGSLMTPRRDGVCDYQVFKSKCSRCGKISYRKMECGGSFADMVPITEAEYKGYLTHRYVRAKFANSPVLHGEPGFLVRL